MSIDLNDYQTRKLSQWGQDGVLDKIFQVIGTTNKYFVEFGSSGTDSGMGNTAQLRRNGFDGLLMDGTKRPYTNDPNDNRYELNIEFIRASNINSLFEKYNVPLEFDLLAIDIDGQDFHVWNRLDSKYKPRVVTIEFNYHILPLKDRVMNWIEDWIWNGSEISGSSITAMKNLGMSKNYSLVATCMSDAVFIRNDLIADKNGMALFKNVNDEVELVKGNTDIYNENLKFKFSENHFDISFFKQSYNFL